MRLQLLAMLLLLSACHGSSDVVRLTEACVESKQISAVLCGCIAEKAVSELSPSARDYLIASLESDEAETSALRDKLAYSEAMRANRVLNTAPGECEMQTSKRSAVVGT